MKRANAVAVSVAVVVAVLGAGSAWADDKVYVIRSQEDPASPADPTICAAAPFKANVMLGASIYSIKTSHNDADVKDDTWSKVGTATACVQLTTLTFPAGIQQKMYVQFNLPDGAFKANGTCTIISNNVPQAGVVLAGCALKLTGGPSWAVGGAVTSNTVFNPLKLPGFNTGSYWTLLVYRNQVGEHDNDSHTGQGHEHDMDFFDDTRTDPQLQAAANGQGN